MNKSEPKRYLVTSALPYANGPLHVGHIAGAYLPADIYVRYLRLMGKDVKYICGSDEHGAAITIRAKQEGISPKEVIDKYHEINKTSFEKIGMSFDIYHRTSEAIHHETASDFFTNLYNKGMFIEKVSEQYYDEGFNQFLADRYIKGTCPKCEHENAYGDQCENCGSSLSPTELINPVSTLSGNTPVLRTTKHWYLRMDEHQAEIKQWLEDVQATEKWKKHVLGQCRSWFQEGLLPRAMTRDLDWGIPVPLPDAEGKVLYVWMDAPIGYISATKALTDDWELYWKDEESKLVHFIGKDNIVFHCINFPMILKMHGDYILPTNVPANQFMNLEGDKMSTSRNHVVSVDGFLAEFEGMEDVLRYALTTNMPENKDSDFSWNDLQARNNSELLAILGNFVNRVLVLTHKYFEGVLPEIPSDDLETVHEKAEEVFAAMQAMPYELDAAIHRYEFRNGLAEVINLARAGNKFLTDTEPWKLIKQSEGQTAAILSICLNIIARLSVYMEPFLPFTAPKVKGFLNLSAEDEKAILAGSFNIAAGHKINKPSLLFSRIEDTQVAAQQQKLADAKAAREVAAANANETTGEAVIAPLKDTIQYDDFIKLDIRTATITAAEKMKKADKLLKLTVEVGFETRTVVSGIAEHFSPEEVVGQQVLLLANLAPRKLRGVESQGMILMAEENGKLVFVKPDNKMGDGMVIS